MKGCVAFLCLLVTCAVLVSGCGTIMKEPTIEAKNVALESFDLSQVGLLVTLEIENPNPVGITFSSITFDVYYPTGDEWVYISHGELEDVEIHPGSNEVTIPVTITTSALPGALMSALTRGEVTLLIKGTASPDFFGIRPPIPFSKVITVPLSTGG